MSTRRDLFISGEFSLFKMLSYAHRTGGELSWIPSEVVNLLRFGSLQSWNILIALTLVNFKITVLHDYWELEVEI